MQDALALGGAHMPGLDRRARSSRSRSSTRCSQAPFEAKPRMPQVTAAHRRPVVGASGGIKARSTRTRPAVTETICQEELPSDMLDMVYQECATAFVSQLMSDAAEDESGEEVEVEMTDSESDAEVEAASSKALATPGEAQVLDALMRGSESGALMEALRPGPFPKAEEANSMKTGLLGTLLGGLRNGSLVGAIRQSQALREEEDVKAKESEEQEELRKTLFGALTSGLATGGLQTALSNATKQRRDREEVERLRVEAQQLLSESAANGGLASTLRKNQEAREVREEETLRLEARRTLLSGIQSGSLFRALLGGRRREEQPKQEEKEEVEGLRMQARHALTQGLHSGALARSLSGTTTTTTTTKAKDEEAQTELLRHQARQMFSQASADGSLSSALQSLEEEKMRKQLLDTLVSGLKTGRLQETMSASASASAVSSMATTTTTSEAKLEAELGEDDGVADMEVLKQQAREALCSGLGSALAASLEALRGEPSPTALAACALAEGLRTGELQSALESTSSGAQVVEPMSDDEAWWNEANEEEDEEEEESDEAAEHLRSMAEESLREALANGRLSDALSTLRPPGLYEEEHKMDRPRAEAEEESSMAELKDQLFTSLLQATRTGRLAEALHGCSREAEEEEEDLESLRGLARETLSGGLGSGALEAALSSIHTARQVELEEMAMLKSDAFSTLLHGIRSGRLADVLSTVREGTEETDLEEEEEEEEQEEEAGDTLRTTVLATLLTGVRTGMFDKAFEQVRPGQADEEDEDDDDDDEESVGFEDVISLTADSENEYMEEQLETMAQTYIDVAFEEAKSTVLASLEKAAARPAATATAAAAAAAAAAPTAAATTAATPAVEAAPAPAAPAEAPAREVIGNVGDFVKENLTPVNFSFFATLFPSKRPTTEAPAAPAPPMVKDVAEVAPPALLKGSASLPALSKVPAKKTLPHVLVQSPIEFDTPSPQTPTKLGELKGVPRCFKSTPNLHFNSGVAFPAGSVRPRSRGAVATFRMDGSDSEEDPTVARQPSITTSFEALGKVTFYNLAAEADSSPKRNRTLKKQTSAHKQGFSAMALDLGLPSPASPSASASASSPKFSRAQHLAPGLASAPVAFGAKTKASFLPCLTPSKSSGADLRMVLDQPLGSPSSSHRHRAATSLFNSASAPSLLA